MLLIKCLCMNNDIFPDWFLLTSSVCTAKQANPQTVRKCFTLQLEKFLQSPKSIKVVRADYLLCFPPLLSRWHGHQQWLSIVSHPEGCCCCCYCCCFLPRIIDNWNSNRFDVVITMIGSTNFLICIQKHPWLQCQCTALLSGLYFSILLTTY